MADKIIGHIYETFDYDKFKFYKSNRDINRPYIKAVLKPSMEQGVILKEILVNSEFYIIDGQHRFTVWKEMELPIKYSIDPNAKESDIPRINVAQSKFNEDAAEHHFIEMGNHNYIRYRKFREKWGVNGNPLAHNKTKCLLMMASGEGNLYKGFMDGKFKTPKNTEVQDRVMEIYQDLYSYIQDPQDASLQLLQGAMILAQCPNYDHNRMISLQERGDPKIRLRKQIDKNEYCKHFVAIYNKGLSDKNKISLSVN